MNFVKGCIVGGIIKMTTTNSNIAYFKGYTAAAAKLIAAGGPTPAQLRQASSASKPSLAIKPKASWGGRGASAGAAGSSSDHQVATMPKSGQVRVAMVFLLMLAGLVHQIVLRNDMVEVHGMLDSVLHGSH